MLSGITLALLLAGGPDSDSGEVRKELDVCARQIEQLKAQRHAGELARRELERLLVRAQELAAELERTRQHLPPSAQQLPLSLRVDPSPEELREIADAARDEADRLAAEIAELDVKLGDARRAAQPAQGAVSAAVLGGASGSPAAAERVRELSTRRAALARQRAHAEAAAARYEAEARAAEADR